jgi:hypothetical protein
MVEMTHDVSDDAENVASTVVARPPQLGAGQRVLIDRA